MMLISFWWVVVAFLVGGTGGAMALAIFSAMPAEDDRHAATLTGISHTH